jgi:serine protease Do
MKEIIHETQKLVVKIETVAGQGSGFLYNDKGDIVTNAHVVAGMKDVTVITADSRELPGIVIGISETIDVAVIRVEGLEGMKPLNISNETSEIGEEVLALGSPFGLENTVTTGIISGVDRNLELPPYYYENVYQISAPIAPGNSGGPLVHSETGKVLGINSVKADQGSIGFSIPILNVIGMLEGWSATPMTSLPNISKLTEGYSYENDMKIFSDEDLALYIVNYFYESLNYQDYITAYSLLGSLWKSDTTYQKFRDSYLTTDSVYIDDLTVRTNDQIKVVAIISAEDRINGTTTYKKYKVSYSVGYENDQLKLLSGKVEEIK